MGGLAARIAEVLDSQMRGLVRRIGGRLKRAPRSRRAALEARRVQVLGQPGRSMRGGGSPAYGDEFDVVFGKTSEQGGEIGNRLACCQARRMSVANRCNSTRLRNRSSTVNLRFSRSKVRLRGLPMQSGCRRSNFGEFQSDPAGAYRFVTMGNSREPSASC
jgi:hypothetical protein